MSKETPTPQLSAEQEELAAAWLDKIFKMLLPARVYKRAHYPNYDKFIRNYLLEHEIAVARDGNSIAVIREGKAFAVWNPV